MKTRKCTKVGLMVLIVLIGGLILDSSHAIAQTQGDVAMKLAALLGLDSSSAENAIAALTAAGVDLAWDAAKPVTGGSTCSLYAAINSAIGTGKITPPSLVPSASALVAAAETAAGLTSTTVVSAIVSCGGNQAQASTGATYGVSRGGPPGPGVGGFGAGPAGAGAAGGGATQKPASLSR